MRYIRFNFLRLYKSINVSLFWWSSNKEFPPLCVSFIFFLFSFDYTLLFARAKKCNVLFYVRSVNKEYYFKAMEPRFVCSLSTRRSNRYSHDSNWVDSVLAKKKKKPVVVSLSANIFKHRRFVHEYVYCVLCLCGQIGV